MSLFSWFVLKHVRIIELQSQKPTSEGLPLPDACLTTCWELLKLKAKLVNFSKKTLTYYKPNRSFYCRSENSEF